MGRTLQDDLRDDVGKVFLACDHFAEMITYIPKGGSAKSIAAIISGVPGGPEQQIHTRTDTRRKSFGIYDGDNTTGHVNPREGDVIVYTEAGVATNWSFSKELKHDIGLWTLEFVTAKAITQGTNRANGL